MNQEARRLAFAKANPYINSHDAGTVLKQHGQTMTRFLSDTEHHKECRKARPVESNSNPGTVNTLDLFQWLGYCKEVQA